jgi:hypothetical protein
MQKDYDFKQVETRINIPSIKQFLLTQLKTNPGYRRIPQAENRQKLHLYQKQNRIPPSMVKSAEIKSKTKQHAIPNAESNNTPSRKP